MAEVDEALVEEVARVLMGTCPDVAPAVAGQMARGVLAHLAPRLTTEEREDWETLDPKYGQWKRVSSLAASPRAVIHGWPIRYRTVRTWRAPDGTVTTQVGPWREVES